MIKDVNRKYWIIWLLGTIGMAIYFSSVLLQGDDKTVFMPGPMTGGHHQIGIACDACHKKAFTEAEDFQEACESCHGETRVKPFDSHPKAKFKDPRNASLLDKINVLQCVTCHSEHRPEMVHKGGFTQPEDFCVHCHSEIGEERPSHKGMDFMTCNDAGCHNYHNNRALYTDFLVKHLHEPQTLDKQQLPKKDFAERLEEIATYPHDRFPVKPLSRKDADAPEKHTGDETIMDDWMTTAHAKSGVTCNACHLVTPPDDAGEPVWTDHPDHQMCAQCHDMEVKHYKEGKHGMRLNVGLSSMTPSEARLPMHAESMDKSLDCMSCHSAHRFDIKEAAVEGCLTCHTDEHSLAYKSSPHYELWQREQAGELSAGSGVSCASCHMPRVDMDVSDWMSRTVVMHNQNATLVPNEKMLRPACLHCHGLEFSINAISDQELIKNNFSGQPSFKTDSMRLAEEDQKRHEERKKEQ